MRAPIAVILAATLLLAACAGTAPSPPPLPPMAWPAPPGEPRVSYLQAFSSAEDLGIQRNLLQRLGDLLFGSEGLHLVLPMAVLQAGPVLYVADPGVRGVHRFDRQAGRHRVLRLDGGRPLPSPVGLARGVEGEVYVTDSALRKVFVIAPGAEFAVEWPMHFELRQPTGVAFDATRGRLFVADTASHTVLMFERDGTLGARIGQRGEGDGQFNFPTLLWLDAAGHLYVTDALNFRVQVFDEQGRFQSKFGRQGDGEGDMALPKGIATDSHGHIYLVDSLHHAMQIFSTSGQLLMTIGGQGRGRGEFWLPAGLFIGDEDVIYIADAYNQRVQVLRYVGVDR